MRGIIYRYIITWSATHASTVGVTNIGKKGKRFTIKLITIRNSKRFRVSEDS